VVATGLPAIRWLGTGLIDVADTPAAFADAVTRALAVPRTPELVAQRRALAAEHSWPRRAEALAGALGIEIS
jgi:teichuronic acid biosynthesis glycosyltransferase TuaH